MPPGELVLDSDRREARALTVSADVHRAVGRVTRLPRVWTRFTDTCYILLEGSPLIPFCFKLFCLLPALSVALHGFWTAAGGPRAPCTQWENVFTCAPTRPFLVSEHTPLINQTDAIRYQLHPCSAETLWADFEFTVNNATTILQWPCVAALPTADCYLLWTMTCLAPFLLVAVLFFVVPLPSVSRRLCHPLRSMSDSDNDDRARRGPSREVGGTLTQMPTSASEARSVVHQFVKDVQPRHIRSRQKEHITAFAKWYFQKKPVLSDSDISYLMLGDGDSKKGLLESCGNSNLKRIGDIKNSSVLALELVVLLLDATVNVHSDKFLDFLPKIPLKIIQSMKLERHILSETSAPDNAFKLLFMLTEQMPRVSLSEFVDHNTEAMERYTEWYNDHMEEKDALGDDGDESSAPRTWAQVKLEDLDKEEASAIGMEADLESVLEAVSQGDEEQETLDPLGLTRITLNARGNLMINKKGSGSSSKSASSSKRMKLFFNKLLKQKAAESEQAAKKGAKGKDGMSAAAAMLGANSKSLSSGGDEDEDEGGGGIHLMDAIMQRGSIDTSLADFNPVLFLTTVHTNTSLAALEQGLNTLQASVNSRTVQMKKLVEQHFGQYVFCKDTIDHLHQLLQSEISSNNKVASSSGRSVPLLRDIEAVRNECEALYAPLLQRKTESDQIRQVLSILGRFKFLFSLPAKLNESRKKQAWEQVIRDYTKAKALVVIKAPTAASNAAASASPNAAAAAAAAAAASSASVSLLSLTNPASQAATAALAASGSLGIPESVLWEIGRIVSDVRRQLFRQLDQPLHPLEDQQKIIGYLLALDCEEDPAYYYLKKQREWIGGLMEKAMEELCAKLEQSLHHSAVIKTFVASAAATGGAAATSPLRLLSGSVPFHLLCIQTPDCVSALNKLIRKLCNTLSRCMPDFFELATSIEAGKFGAFRGAPGGASGPAVAGAPVTNSPVVGSPKAEESKHDSPHLPPSGSGPAHRGSLHETALAALSLTPGLAPTGSPTATANTSLSALASSPGGANDSPSVGRLIASINTQFASYVRLALFPPSAAHLARNPAAVAAASSASPTGGDLGFDSGNQAVLPNGGGLNPDLFPPAMYSHVNDVLTCIEAVRALPTMPLQYVSELRLLSDQLTQLYLDHHVRELLQYVSAMHKDETWELDAEVGNEHDIVALFGAAGSASVAAALGGEGFSFAASGSNDSSSSHNAPLGHGHAGSSASNAPFQVTLLPGSFHAALSSTLHSFEALPSIKSKWVVERIVSAVFEAMKCFADGMHALAAQIVAQQNAQGYAMERPTSSLSGLASSSSQLQSSSIVSSWIRPNELDRRLLLVWSNLLHTHDQLLSPLLDQLLALLPLSTHKVLDQKFDDDVSHLYVNILEDALVLDAYKKSKNMQIGQIVKKGYFKNGINWTQQHTTVSTTAGGSSSSSSSAASSSYRAPLLCRSCVLELLLQFVLIHDELYTVRKELVDEVIESIAETLAYTLANMIKKIHLLCDVWGANQLLVELLLIESSLDYYWCDESQRVMDECKERMENRLESEAAVAAVGAKARAAILEQAKSDRNHMLQQMKQSTSMMYASFTSTLIRKKKNAAATAPTSAAAKSSK